MVKWQGRRLTPKSGSDQLEKKHDFLRENQIQLLNKPLFQEMVMVVVVVFKVNFYSIYLLGVLTCSVLVFECTNIVIVAYL